MHEIWLKIYAYLRGTWRFRWYAIVVAWLIAIIGWPLVFQMPDHYQSSARIHVDTDSLLRPLLRGLTIEPNLQQRLDLMTRTLLSRPNLEKLARMTDMDLTAKTPAQMEALLNRLESGIHIGSGRGHNIYTISYKDKDPQLTKDVVQAVVTTFMEDALGATRQDRDSAQQFLEQQIKEYENKIRATEMKLMDMKRKYKGSMPGELVDYFRQLENLEGRLQAAHTELEVARTRRDELERQLSGEQALAASGSSPIDTRIRSLEKKLDDLSLRYTEKHPDVIATKEVIATLRQQKQAFIEEGKSGEALSKDNPFYQQLRVALVTAEGEVASQEARVAALEEEMKQVRGFIDNMPKLALEISQLKRDYGINKRNYHTLLERQESAEMSERVEQSTDNIQFRVIDPPKVPLRPSGPNRPVLLSLVLLVGVGAGVGVAFLLSQLKPTFTDRNELQELTQLPVLGSVSVLWTRQALIKQRVRLAAFLFSSSLLVVAYGLVMSVDFFDIKIFKVIGI
ncbi:XrtA system polysaccharide chain length determinant [Nitrosococcus wardiae]|uniref:Chain-length determining protein n=1 Tax=Nitrosococcus wardiae TaxID=1814290 RepID=A0A4V1AVV7_9GAMM|nr:XrtA system polysaccharide chain length determinant [Nitrosococcus wardiae]QBQ54475.1 chain-length determining protein [Nitrosococcus wardiae]